MFLNTPTENALKDSSVPGWIFVATDDGALSGSELSLVKIAQDSLSAEQWARKRFGL